MPSPESSDLLFALGRVVRLLKQRPMPEHHSLTGIPFAPRHVSTLLQISQEAPVGVK